MRAQRLKDEETETELHLFCHLWMPGEMTKDAVLTLPANIKKLIFEWLDCFIINWTLQQIMSMFAIFKPFFFAGGRAFLAERKSLEVLNKYIRNSGKFFWWIKFVETFWLQRYLKPLECIWRNIGVVLYILKLLWNGMFNFFQTYTYI